MTREQILRDALARLVSLKDGPRDDSYSLQKNFAWEVARSALTDSPEESVTQRYIEKLETIVSDLTLANHNLNHLVDQHNNEEAYARVLRINDNLRCEIEELKGRLPDALVLLDACALAGGGLMVAKILNKVPPGGFEKAEESIQALRKLAGIK